MSKIDVPRKSIYRLSIYQRCLDRLRANSIDTVSSEALAKAAGVKSTQLRKDLAYFGQFGTRGLGYSVENLISVIDEVLGIATYQPVVLIGVGNLGAALLCYQGFSKEGFKITAAFDHDPDRKRVPVGGIPIYDSSRLRQFIEDHNVKMAIVAVPAKSAQETVNDLVAAGVQAILNFSPTVLETPENVFVNSVDLAMELENLSYFIK